ncbi:IclR family transcriptional regulator [Xylanibacillus composti]|uniref:Glycerol operon regulatory protein n=1 Tax=Xylanibacillus composti TaxID=1572762 RepID=A0A8J4M1X8_9BACL|nr:IclR family transcriptional regulator [Xylanibacillus composti]MDT9725347.1 IclR family transcriptional regulator [Xylanibacillus composti]GIQ69109.1 IclR family transcriptional regulator [Xylanibacillus composti]
MPIIQAVDRALRILDLFNEQTKELKISEISAQMQLHKSTVHSLLKTLQLHGYMEQNPATGQYRLGIKLVERGQLLLQGFDIRALARPFLQQLSDETGQTTHLVIMEGAHGVYIDKVEGTRAPIRYSRVGRRIPLHSSACGKILAAFLPAEKLHRLLESYDFSPHTSHTIRSREKFLQALELVCQEGIAFDREENEPGVRCAAAPILDHTGEVIAAISISTTVSHVDETELLQLGHRLRQVSERISRQLGHTF